MAIATATTPAPAGNSAQQAPDPAAQKKPTKAVQRIIDRLNADRLKLVAKYEAIGAEIAKIDRAIASLL